MITHKNSDGKILKTEIEDKKQRMNGEDEIEEIDESEDYCYECGSDDDYLLMICDGCEIKVCHSYCAGFG